MIITNLLTDYILVSPWTRILIFITFYFIVREFHFLGTEYSYSIANCMEENPGGNKNSTPDKLSWEEKAKKSEAESKNLRTELMAMTKKAEANVRAYKDIQKEQIQIIKEYQNLRAQQVESDAKRIADLRQASNHFILGLMHSPPIELHRLREVFPNLEEEVRDFTEALKQVPNQIEGEVERRVERRYSALMSELNNQESKNAELTKQITDLHERLRSVPPIAEAKTSTSSMELKHAEQKKELFSLKPKRPGVTTETINQNHYQKQVVLNELKRWFDAKDRR